MTNDNERDTEIAAVLDRVTVPDHGPGFWAGLEDRLADEAGPAATPLRPLRPRRFPRLLAVAAAVALFAAATAVLLDDDDEQSVRIEPADNSTSTTETTVPATTSTTTAPSTTTTTATPATATATKTGGATADGAALEWIEAIGAGDIDKAARLTGPQSEAYIKSLGGNLRGMLVESQEGWGGWADSPDRSTTEIELGAVGGVERTVVVILGTNNGEGEGGYRADPLPVAKSGRGGTWLVEFYAGPRITMVSPSEGESGLNGLAADAKIEARADTAGTFYFSLDDSPPAAVKGQPAGTGARAAWDPPGDMKSQSHLLVVAYVDAQQFAARAGIVAVEG